MIPYTIQRAISVPAGLREIWLAGGCFWGTEQYLAGVHGVVHTSVGYANGKTPAPTYEQVCSHTTGYAEAVHIVYDPQVLTLRFLLELYFRSVNPTSLNRQGGDIGEQYRTGIYYLDEEELPVIREAVAALAVTLDRPVAIEVAPLRNYFLAEEYHQRYLDKNPGGYCHISTEKLAYARQAREYQRPDNDALRARLTPEQYAVTRQNATEAPFQNEYHDRFEPGIYVDITTGEPLFLSTDKFESGCGWPAFSRPINRELLDELPDTSLGRLRTEVRSRTGGAHLGHVFEDGPTRLGGLRYCINSAALRFVRKADMEMEGYGYLLPLLQQNP